MSEPPITGTVKWFNTTKGYGFLDTATHGDLFVHVSALAEGRTALHPGERVTCGVQQGRNGPEACDVHVTEPAPPAPAPVARGVHDPAIANAVATIATQLGETAPGAQQQIRRIVGRLGADAALAFLTQAQELEAAGGMMLPDGSRRRTPGGVFFALVRASVSATDRADLFPPFIRRPKAARKASSGTQEQPRSAPSSTQAQPSTPPFSWADRIAAVQTLGDSRGEIRTVKVTLIGRPGKIVEKPGLVLTAMESAKVPALPKGLPTPPATPTTYIVYIARKQWAGVTESLKNPEDALIVEGWAVYDPELEGIAVFAMNTTTKLLQAAKRQQQAPREAQPGA